MGLIEDQEKANKERMEQQGLSSIEPEPPITAGQIALVILIVIGGAAAILLLGKDGIPKGTKEVEVQIGSYNDTYVVITEGLEEGDKVLLVPPKIGDVDLGPKEALGTGEVLDPDKLSPIIDEADKAPPEMVEMSVGGRVVFDDVTEPNKLMTMETIEYEDRTIYIEEELDTIEAEIIADEIADQNDG